MTGIIRYRRAPCVRESWDVAQSWDEARPDEVPRTAERDYGYVDASGVEHAVYSRIAPAGECSGGVYRARKAVARG